MNIKNTCFTILTSAIILLVGCNKKYDSPPVAVLPAGDIITIDSLRNIYTAFDSTFTDNLSIFGVITADEMSGNLYKNLYLQDGTNAILLKLTSSSSKTFFEGDSIRVALKGTMISRYKNMLQLANVDPVLNMIKQSKGKTIAPKVVTIADLALGSNIYAPYQAQLVQLNNVEFICNDIWSTYSDAIGQTNQNRTLTDTLGNTIIVRTSGFANFAGTPLQQGRGSFVALVSQYNTTVQLVIRQLSDLKLTGTRKTTCPIYMKNFEDQNLTSGGWSAQNVTGNINWVVNNVGSNGTYYAQISNYNGSSNTACETWLVSPTFDLSAMVSPYMSFQSAYKYTGAALKLFITTNYTGDATTTTWTDISSSAIWSAGSFIWTPSGNVNLSSYKQPNVRFAFKYVGTAIDGSTWEIDDITLNDI